MNNKRRTTEIVGVIVGLILFAVLFVVVLNAYQQEGENRSALTTTGATAETQANRLNISAKVVSIDFNKGEISVRLVISPEGDLASQDGLAVTKDIKITTNSDTKGEVLLKKGQRLSASDITLSLYDGQVSDYPFDSHSAALDLYATTLAEDKSELSVPIQLTFFGSISGVAINAEPDAESNGAYAYIGATITRSSVTKAVAIAIIVFMWLMALTVIALTLSVMLRGRKVELSMFSWLASMMFALVGFRNASPGAPGIGSFMDFISFFWAEILIAGCVVILMVINLRRPIGK